MCSSVYAYLYTPVRKVSAEREVLWPSTGGNESTRTTFTVQIIHKFLYQYLHCNQDIATVPLFPRRLCERGCTIYTQAAGFSPLLVVARKSARTPTQLFYAPKGIALITGWMIGCGAGVVDLWSGDALDVG